MYSQSNLRFLRLKLVLVLVSPWWAAIAPAYANTMTKVWRTVYERLHPGAVAPWRGQEDAIAWAKAERDLVEPIVIAIISGEEPGIQWTAGLAIARHIPSPPICELLAQEGRHIIDGAPRKHIEPGSIDELGLVNILDILADQRHKSVRPMVLELATQAEQSALLIEHCLRALLKLVTQEDADVVRQIAARHMNQDIDRLCSLAEKAIASRVNGRDMFVNANEELRTVTRKWIEAIEAQDMEAYLKVLPFGAQGGIDEHDFRVELLESPEIPKFLEAAKKAARQDVFEIDRDKLEASMVVDGKYRFVYVLETDGWKIHGPEKVAP